MKHEFIRYEGKEMNSSTARKISSGNVRAMEVCRSLDVEVVQRISSRLGINAMIPGNASVMLYSQLLDRHAINRMPEYLRETEILRYLGIEGIDTVDLYESLQEINHIDFSAMEEKRSVIIDVTDTYFTGDSLDSRPRKGKESRIKTLMQIALLVTAKRGFQLFHHVYPGNVSNRSIMDDVVKDLWLKGYMAIVIDRGMPIQRE